MNVVERYFKAARNVYREVDTPGTDLHEAFWHSSAPMTGLGLGAFFGVAVNREARRLKDELNPTVN